MGPCSVGYRVINERATVEPQFRDASLKSEYVPIYQEQPVWSHLWPNLPQ